MFNENFGFAQEFLWDFNTKIIESFYVMNPKAMRLMVGGKVAPKASSHRAIPNQTPGRMTVGPMPMSPMSQVPLFTGNEPLKIELPGSKNS